MTIAYGKKSVFNNMIGNNTKASGNLKKISGYGFIFSGAF